jgi:transposase
MNTSLAELRSQAVALRRAGKSRREIKEMLAITSNWTLNEVLRGEPPPQWTRRPNAKDDRRAAARQLRDQGLAYNEIAARLGVSKSSISLWVRDMPRPERLSYEASRQRQAAGVAAYWAAERQRREDAKVAVSRAAAQELGQLTSREILIAGAIAYWCEGEKNKPYRRRDRISFINSDPMMIKFFLRFLETAGVTPDRLIFRVSIHETADLAAAERFWRQTIDVEGAQFNRALIKRHKPLTNRKNVGADYHGCLNILVRCSTGLYRQIEGWAAATMADPPSRANRGAPADGSAEANWSDPGRPTAQLPGEDSNLGEGHQKTPSCRLDDPGP